MHVCSIPKPHLTLTAQRTEDGQAPRPAGLPRLVYRVGGRFLLQGVFPTPGQACVSCTGWHALYHQPPAPVNRIATLFSKI